MQTIIAAIKQIAIVAAGVMVTGGVLYLLNQGKAGTALQGLSQKITSGFGVGASS